MNLIQLRKLNLSLEHLNEHRMNVDGDLFSSDIEEDKAIIKDE